MDFNGFKTQLETQILEFNTWDEQEWQDEYTSFRETIASWDSNWLKEVTDEFLIEYYAKSHYQDLRRDTHNAALKEKHLTTTPYVVYVACMDEEIAHEIVLSCDRVTAIEKVILSTIAKVEHRDEMKLWFQKLNGSSYEDIIGELIECEYMVSCLDYNKEIKSLKK